MRPTRFPAAVAARLSADELWRQRDFLKLWAGQTVSLFGSQLTELALPLTAVLLLGATPVQMGLQVAAETLPELPELLLGFWPAPGLTACAAVR